MFKRVPGSTAWITESGIYVQCSSNTSWCLSMTGKVRSLVWCVEFPTSDLSSDYETHTAELVIIYWIQALGQGWSQSQPAAELVIIYWIQALGQGWSQSQPAGELVSTNLTVNCHQTDPWLPSQLQDITAHGQHQIIMIILSVFY